MNVQVLGISVDHIPCLQAWAQSLGEIDFPLLSDFWPHGEVAEKYGVMRDGGMTERALFIIDREGIIRYIDIHDIGDQPSNEVLFAELEKIVPKADRQAGYEPPAEEALPSGGVVMYCTDWCTDCRLARRWLDQHKIDYTEVNVDNNATAARQVREWANGDLETPTFDIDGQILVGFNSLKLKEILLKD